MPAHKHCRLFWPIGGWPSTRSATVRDNLLGPLRLIRSSPPTWNTEFRYSYFYWMIRFPYFSWESQYYQTPEIDRISWKSATFLSYLKMSNSNREKNDDTWAIKIPQSVFVFPIRNVFSFDRNLTLFTALLWLDFVATKRCLLKVRLVHFRRAL